MKLRLWTETSPSDTCFARLAMRRWSYDMTFNSDEQLLADYFDLMQKNPKWFANHPRGGIEILADPAEIADAQSEARLTRSTMGLDIRDMRVGLLASDPYMTFVRDAVRFPNGTLGLYNRIMETSPVAVLPLLDGKPVLMQVFRHGLRNWSLEFPRGAADLNESAEAAARREVKEEIGAETCKLIPLGMFTPGGSSLSIRAHLFLAHIDSIGASDPLEGIEQVRAFEISEVEEKVSSGEVIDGFSMALFLRARLKGYV